MESVETLPIAAKVCLAQIGAQIDARTPVVSPPPRYETFVPDMALNRARMATSATVTLLLGFPEPKVPERFQLLSLTV
mgnify:CR=1 FL=1